MADLAKKMTEIYDLMSFFTKSLLKAFFLLNSTLNFNFFGLILINNEFGFCLVLD